MGMRAPSREEASFTLAVIEASPGNPARNVSRARLLLNDLIASGLSPARSQAAEFILSLLLMEEEHMKEVAELRSQIEASRGEMEGLKATLAQRETELRKIKEILLETKPGS